MGLFKWFTSRANSFDNIENSIWLSKTAKYKGIEKEIANPIGFQRILVVAHFEDCMEQLQLALGNVVRIIYASDLAQHLSEPVSDTLLLVAERHPFHVHDDLLLQRSQNQPYPCRVRYHISLEDFILQQFVSERTKKILRALGMEESEPVKSRMVDYRIKKALNQIAKKIRNDYFAASAEEWFEKNVLD